MVAVNKTSKSYKVQRDLWEGQRGRRRLIKTVRHTLGTTEDLTLEDARHKAEDAIRLLRRGVDGHALSRDPPIPNNRNMESRVRENLIALCKRLREARQRAGLSQVDVARRIGKSKQLVSAWGTGRSEMTATTLGNFARIVSADPGWLLHGVRYLKGGPDAASLPQGCVLPLLIESEALEHARGKLDLDAVPRRIYCSFASGSGAFALEIGDDAMAPKLSRGDLVVVEPERMAMPGAVVAAVIKGAAVALERPLFVVRHIHDRSPSLGAAPFDLAPSVAAWPTLANAKGGQVKLLGAVAMIFKREACFP